MPTTKTSNRIAALRAQLERYDDALSGVEHRLDAAKAGSDAGSDADGLRAQLDVLIAEQDRVRTDLVNLEKRLENGGATELDVRAATGLFTIRLEQLRIERERLEGGLAMSRSAGSSSVEAIADEDVVATNPELAAEVAQLLRELEYVRGQARTMMAERDRLRTEIHQLEAVRARLQSELQNPQSYQGPERRAQPQSTFDLESPGEEGEAFDRFFNAETGRDKAREWILR